MTALHLEPAPDADRAPDGGPVTPRGLIRLARDAHTRREQADRDVLGLALGWATMHEVHGPVRREQSGPAATVGQGTGEFPDPPTPDVTDPDQYDDVDLVEDQTRREWRGLPQITWDAAAPFAAALGMTTRAGRTLIRHALTLAHRLPRTQAHWEAGHIATRPARLVADAVAGQPDDVCAWVDVQVAARIRLHHSVGPVIAERLVQEALAELHAEQLELERQERLQARYAKLVPSIDSSDGTSGPDVYGLAEFAIRGEWPDIKAFNDTIAALAQALRRGDGPEASESLDARRSIAVGILADPLRAAALLGLGSMADQSTTHPTTQTTTHPTTYPTTQPKQRILLTVHLTAEAVTGTGTGTGDGWLRSSAPVGVDTHGRVWLEAVIRDWIARRDTDVTVRPVVHCGGCSDCEASCDQHHRQSYTPTDLDKERVAIRTPHCVFPFCTTPAGRCDCDHIVAFDPQHPDRGPTCPRCNLAPLCRHHHRLKTHAGWTYRQVEPGVFTWTEPHGQTFLTTRCGTRDTTDD